MPRPRVDPRYEEQVASLAEEGKRPPEITRLIQRGAERDGHGDAPSERSVRRLYEKHMAKRPELRRESAYFRWPKSMLTGVLPWEASQLGLELLRHLDEQAHAAEAWLVNHSSGGARFRFDSPSDQLWRRPTNRTVRWLWRVKTAAPWLSLELAYRIAAQIEYADLNSDGTPFELPVEEMALAYTLDRTALDGRLPAGWLELIEEGPAMLDGKGEPVERLMPGESD